GRVVAERHASVRLAIGTEHVGMCKQPISAEHFPVADWNKANGTNAMEGFLAHHEFVGIRRRGPLPLQVHIASIIHVAAKARMRFQPASVLHVQILEINKQLMARYVANALHSWAMLINAVGWAEPAKRPEC